MLRVIICVIGLSAALPGFTQDLTLKGCVDATLYNNPLRSNRELVGRMAEIKKEIIRSAWYPTLDLNAQASWQSDVVTLNLDLPFPVDFPSIPRDQYKVTADITQLVYDGGMARLQAESEEISALLSNQEMEIRDHELRQVVEDLFFSALVLEKRKEVADVMAKGLEETILQIQAGIRNGTASDADLAPVVAERLRLDQQKIILEGQKVRAIRTLSILMGVDLQDDARLTVPEQPYPGLQGLRPEMDWYRIQGEQFDLKSRMTKAQRLPKFAAFGQAGYGRPGLNFLGDQWDPYLLVGIRGNWNIWDWGKAKKWRDTYEIGRQTVQNQERAFLKNLDQSETRQMLLIDELARLLKSDEELVAIREGITRAARSKLAGGILTSSQYLTEWTREEEARLGYESRKIEWLSAQYKLLTIKGIK